MAHQRISPSDARRGLTIVEMLVSVVLLAALAVLGISVTGRLSQKGRDVRCLTHLRQIWLRTLTYCNQHNGRFPYAFLKEEYRFWPQEINDAAGDADVRSYLCPSVKESDVNSALLRGIGGFAFVSYGINFEGISASTGATPRYTPARLSDLPEPSRVVAFMDYDEPLQPADGWYLVYPSKAKDNWEVFARRHGGRVNAIFCDGHAAEVTKEELFPQPYPYRDPPWVSYRYIRPL